MASERSKSARQSVRWLLGSLTMPPELHTSGASIPSWPSDWQGPSIASTRAEHRPDPGSGGAGHGRGRARPQSSIPVQERPIDIECQDLIVRNRHDRRETSCLSYRSIDRSADSPTTPWGRTIPHAVDPLTNPKRKRGPQPISSLTLRVSISPRRTVSSCPRRV